MPVYPSSVANRTSYDPRRVDIRRWRGVTLCLLLITLGAIASLMLGAKSIAPETVWMSLTGQLHNADSIIILDARLPRTLAGIIAGIALGGSGALIQALTRNPLADPGILGVNAGASFAIVMGIIWFGITDMASWLGFAWLGVLVTSVVVWVIGSLSGGRVNPIRLTLTGVALSAVLTGITSSVSLLNPDAFDQMRMWEAGTLDIRSLHNIALVAPIVLLGGGLALIIARALNALSMGDDIATALGTRTVLIRSVAVIAIMLMCGSATALVGPIGFVGLMIPHIARWWAGPDQRWIVFYSMLLAPVLLLCADILARLLAPSELRVSIITAFIGAPVLIWLVRRHNIVGNER
ncbi:Fe(3+)-siderophore ABC transporter permease [Pectobacterium wasabiae]|uniref:ABC transporter permease n=1 Tax=Pectobacterium wasabiae TaxID=55208 RepID=A0AAW3EJV3_9GAMM|nr:Fe(3+)-siderophore ABC transporter permease [Pectobacterium wasabiae]AOR62385.1 ABC transporter permease [Pectobacterium wasabiae CFBP 3304]EJS93053.1 Ferric enterobactin transport system permease fepD [Pectobacterium wasabiae CFBP 3304]KFX06430.1 ABC transporter permease [Pectobacterium wasabiae]KGA28265.1 ABC transporter permease [Pectobacterium wasabiae]